MILGYCWIYPLLMTIGTEILILPLKNGGSFYRDVDLPVSVQRTWEGGSFMKAVGLDGGFTAAFRVIWLSFPGFAFQSSVCVS